MIQSNFIKPIYNEKNSLFLLNSNVKRDNFFIPLFIAFLISTLFSSFSHATDLTRHNKAIKGIAITGFNMVRGRPAANLRFIGETSFPIISAISEDGEIRAIDNETEPDDLIISNAIDQIYTNIFGIADTQSIPLQGNDFADLPQLTDLAGNESILPQLSENADWWTRSNGAQLRGYKVKQWLKAKGKLRIQCRNDKEAVYKLKLRNLVPGGLYTVQAFFFDQQENQLITDIPFGGTSANVFSADFRGNASVNQALNFCPDEIDESDRFQLIEVCVVLHTDGKVYAGVPHTVLKKPYIGPGINALPHIMFPIK